MTKRGVVLLLSLVVFLVLAVIAAAYFTRTMSENTSVQRYVTSSQALWHAEEGLAQATRQLPVADGTVVNTANYTTLTNDEGSGLFNITSTGRALVKGVPVTRTIESFVAVNQSQFGDFDKAIEVRGNLSIPSASVDINPDESYADDYADFTFSDRFGVSTEQVKYAAMSGQPGYVYYDEDTVPKPLSFADDSVVWIELNSTKPPKLQLPNPGGGSGIIIINSPNGDIDIEGGDFGGIIWAIGELKIAGVTNVTGSILSECAVNVTTFAGGNANLTWDPNSINASLTLLDSLAPRTAKSWRELP